MLTSKKITIEAKTIVEEREIAGHRAIISADDIRFLPWQIDKDACKAYRKTIREDQADFEDYAYDLQEAIFSKENGGN